MSTTQSWKRAEFKIAVNPRAFPQTDPGFRVGYTRGPFGIAKGTWVITHLASGLICCDRAERWKEAKEIAERLLPLADWNDLDPLRKIDDAQRMKIRAVALKQAAQ